MIALPDPDDRHVVAAAVQCGAEAIVTLNRRDFPDHEVTKWGIEIKHPDDFVMESIAIAPVTVARCLREQAAALSSPPQTVEEVLGRLRICGLAQSSVRLRELLGEAGLK